MSLLKVIVLAVIQGLAELLPVSSSAHVVVAEKLMGMDPSSPAMTLLLVMLHTGTMFAVIVYFWKQWRETFFADSESFKRFAWLAVIATVCTGIVGEALIKMIEHTYLQGRAEGADRRFVRAPGDCCAGAAGGGRADSVAGLMQGRRPDSEESAGDRVWAGGGDWGGARAVSAVSRILALGGDDFGGHSAEASGKRGWRRSVLRWR